VTNGKEVIPSSVEEQPEIDEKSEDEVEATTPFKNEDTPNSSPHNPSSEQ
jgi:hypothetical protein